MITLNKYDINRACGSMTELGSYTTKLHLAMNGVYGMYDTYGITVKLKGEVKLAVLLSIQLPIMLQLRSLYNQYKIAIEF